ncbi:hypothetical protein [Leptospira koniambonensis]|uniref:hypothetical protein n=1 Tax=Leptospira koniambonensis TaxID=2484950 RepID=UPI003EB7B192
MNPLRSEVEKFKDIVVFREFVKTFSLNFFYDEWYLYVFNEHILLRIYTEYGEPFWEVFNIPKRKMSELAKFMKEKYLSLEKAREIYYSYEKDLPSEGLIENRIFLVWLYTNIRIITESIPDLFEESSYEKYNEEFTPIYFTTEQKIKAAMIKHGYGDYVSHWKGKDD